MPDNADHLVSIQGLSVNLMSSRGAVRAVRSIDLSVKMGEIHGLVGESGCGKSMTAKAIMRLHNEKAMLYSGRIMYNDQNIFDLKQREMQALRGKEISMIFQDPMTALNPIRSVGSQIEEILLLHRICGKAEAKERAVKLLEDVGIHPAAERCRQYPFEMSGGMLQRVVIAMAIACKPKLLIADEPTTALDVTVQEQILQLLLKLQQKRNMSVLIITHNFGVVAEICHRVSVMYAGNIVESGEVHEIFHHPRHPYTRDLMQSIPQPKSRGKKLVTIQGTPPDLKFKITGCPYAPRCSMADDLCRQSAPVSRQESATHSFSCHKTLERGQEA
ncbi:MAG TPA: ABC transporter ATP-binding protein [Pseudoflavonifractor sp.]|nr:ABC transporter ATP-binding protein [Pseudoflavonifractor sp.]